MPATHILRLQRQAGNAAVQRLLATPGSTAATLARMEAEHKEPAKPKVEEGRIYERKAGPYGVGWGDLTDDGATLLVMVADEPKPVGRATFKMKTISVRDRPARDEPYTTEHVVGSALGKVAHLSGIYNDTLGRDGPADIYSGFGVQMLTTVEKKAKELGAWMIYLEAAPSPVRQDPNTNEKVVTDPAGFYKRFGWMPDPVQKIHNSMFLRAQAKELGLQPADAAAYVENMLRSHQAAVWIKMLVK